MAAVNDVHNDGFSFIWTILNLNYCIQKSCGILESPKFNLKEDRYRRWCLILYPKGTYKSDTIGLRLRSCTDSSYDKCELRFELSICTGLGIFEDKKYQEQIFKGYYPEFGFESTFRLKDLYKKRQLNNDPFTVACRILEIDNKPVASGQSHIRTMIVVERNTCSWKLANFEELMKDELVQNRTIQLPIVSEISSFSMKLSSTGGVFAEDEIQVDIKPIDPVTKRMFSTCQMSLLDVDGKQVYTVRDEHTFEKSENEQIWKTLFISMDKLLSRKELYLPNDTLYLRCEFAVSSGATHNEVESNECGIANLSKLEHFKHKTDSCIPKSLNDNLKSFYMDGKFSDLTIRTPSNEFRVHKTILCARSEVFSAMFESDTKEKLTGVIEIEDIDDDTVSKMLMFMYTDSVGEDLVFETASKLYFAAVTYGIVALKEKCADFLKGNFTMANVCDVLVLADLHQDQELKTAAQNFIFENSSELMDSDEWNNLMQNNIQLASETMRLALRN